MGRETRARRERRRLVDKTRAGSKEGCKGLEITCALFLVPETDGLVSTEAELFAVRQQDFNEVSESEEERDWRKEASSLVRAHGVQAPVGKQGRQRGPRSGVRGN